MAKRATVSGGGKKSRNPMPRHPRTSFLFCRSRRAEPGRRRAHAARDCFVSVRFLGTLVDSRRASWSILLAFFFLIFENLCWVCRTCSTKGSPPLPLRPDELPVRDYTGTGIALCEPGRPVYSIASSAGTAVLVVLRVEGTRQPEAEDPEGGIPDFQRNGIRRSITSSAFEQVDGRGQE